MNQGIVLSDSVLDVPGTLARLGGDRALYVDLVDFLLVDAPQCYRQLQRSVEKEDAGQVRFHAHSLKGLVAGCGGLRAAGAAQLVESASQTPEFENVKSLMVPLQKELESLRQALTEYRAQIAADNSSGRPRWGS